MTERITQNITCSWEKTGQDGQESGKKNTKKQVCNELEAAGRQVSVSAVKCVLHQLELRGCRASEKPLAPDVEP